jgi:benzoyl-CoA reductase/2-hydroxyglutaryl-CoA dehydratase subunit BcrC/BadD/HgdB
MPARRSLKTTQKVFDRMMTFASEVQKAKSEGKPVVWSSILIPQEIFHAMGVPVIAVEGIATLVSVMGLSGRYCELTEDEGYSRDVCAFQRAYMGCALAAGSDPFLEGIFVPPDIVVASNFSCMSSSKSFLFTVDRYGCPYFFWDIPLGIWREDNVPDYAVDYCVSQLEGLIRFLEEHGYKFDEDRLKHEIDISRRIMIIREEVDEYSRAVPAPIGGLDGFLSPLLVAHLWSGEIGLELLEELRDELKERVENKVGIIEDEKLRLFWYTLPAMYNMELLHYPEQYGAVIVKSTAEWLVGAALEPGTLNPDKPLQSLAVKAIAAALNPPCSTIVDFAVDVVKRYKVDGVIAPVKRSCGLIPGTIRLVKDAIFEKTGVPTVIFDLDYADSREYDDAAVKANLDPFIETLLASKGG